VTLRDSGAVYKCTDYYYYYYVDIDFDVDVDQLDHVDIDVNFEVNVNTPKFSSVSSTVPRIDINCCYQRIFIRRIIFRYKQIQHSLSYIV